MKTSFNDQWLFYRQDDRANASAVTLPHDAMLIEARTADAPGKGASGYFPEGRYVYEKTFVIDLDPAEKKVTFEFEGVYKNALVSINGQEACRGAYGYIPFYVEAESFLHTGENVIRVEADNAEQPCSRWYSGAGIYRPVWMHVQEKVHIALDGIRIRTVGLEPPAIEVRTAHTGGEIRISILDDENENGQELGSGAGDEALIELPAAQLWSADTPKLYTAVVTLREGERVIEERRERFGIRQVSWSPQGLFVNGKETLLRGGCLHHDNGLLGAREFDESARRKIRILKENGFNAIRSAHNPASSAILKACDELGMYVMDETWDMWYRNKNPYDYANDFMDHYRDDLTALVARDYNHPSVIMYSIGNEVSEPAEERGLALAVEMRDMLHALDDTRAVTGGFNLMIIGNAAKGKQMYKEGGGRDDSSDQKMNGMNSTMFNMIASLVGSGMNMAANSKRTDRVVSPLLDAMDIAGYNYASGRYGMEGKLHPDRVVVGSETFPQDLAKNWEMVRRYPYLVGDFMWTAWDYLGEAGIGTWSYEADAKGFDKPFPWLLADTGAFDILGNPTGEALWARAVWEESGKPYLAVRPVDHPGEKLIKAVWRGTNAIPSWSWKGCEGNEAVVEVYTTAPYAELFLDRKRVGRKRTKNARAIFKLKYEPGELAARSLDSAGKVLGKTRLISAGQEWIRILPEKESCRAGELLYLNIALADKRGITQSSARADLRIEVEGGELLGFGSANPRTLQRYDTGEFATWYGKAQAIVRAGEPGQITVKVTGAPYKGAKVSISVE